MARGFENVCEIQFRIKASEILEKSSTRGNYNRNKNGEKGTKKLLSTLECLNYKKSSQQLPSCFIAMRYSPFCKMFSPLFCFEQEKTLKNFSNKSKIKDRKRGEAKTKSSVWDLKMPNY